ncbi:MAG: AEC family transporter [Rhizobiaceae bacterium]
MIEIFSAVLPVFILIGVAYLAVRLGYLKPIIADALNAFAIKLAVPILLFRAMLTLDFSAAFYPPMIIAFFVGTFSCFILGIVLSRTVWNRRPGEAVAVGFMAMFSNTVMLGLPIIDRAYGENTLTPAFGIVSMHAPLLYVVGMITMEMSRRDGRPLGETLVSAGRSIITNALMIGIAIGIAFNFSSITLPEPIMAAVDMFAAAAIPAALIGTGAALTRYGLLNDLSESLTVSALQLIIHPAIAFVLAHFVFGLDPVYVRAAVILAAMPPGMNVYIFAVIYNRAVALAASTMLIATLLSIVSISIWIATLNTVLGTP